jgi:hypothetical protein
MIDRAMTGPSSLFTLEAVNALVPRLKALMATQLERRTAIEERLGRLAELVGSVPNVIAVEAGDPPQVRTLKADLAERVEDYQSAWREVEDMGAVLKDPRMGLVDFYGQVDGKFVWLCWRYGEDAVTHYHGLDEGFANRKLIESTMRQRHLN